MQRADGVWEPGSRRWLVHRRRVGPLGASGGNGLHRTAALSDDHDIAERRPLISPALKLRTDDPGRGELSVERVHWPA